jgi:amino acid transporter
MASSGPTASIALTLAAIVSASNYGGPIAILICGLPMFGIALAYRRLNRWQVDCGASYTWIGRAISPGAGHGISLACPAPAAQTGRGPVSDWAG